MTERNARNGQKEALVKLIQGGELYCPDHRGRKDILIVGGIIARVAERIEIPKDFLDVAVVDASDRIVTPGFIDQHCHLIGAGGSSGPVTRTREIKIQQICQAGITTIVGCLGFDSVTRDLKRLLVKAQALELQGVTTFIYTGSYIFPPATVTGSIESDLLLINRVLGIKLALGEVSTTCPDEKDLKGLMVAGYRGSLLSGKAGVLHVHMGDVPGEWFSIIERILRDTTIPLTKVVFTHSNRSTQVFDRAVEYGKKGGMVDVTAVINPDLMPGGDLGDTEAIGLRKPSRAIEEMLIAGVPEDNITLSSDSNASVMLTGGYLLYTPASALHKEFKDFADSTKNISIALKMVTLNPATRLAISSCKGTLDEGKDADILILTRDLQIQDVYARGKLMVKEGDPVVRDPFE